MKQIIRIIIGSLILFLVTACLVAKSHPTLCNPMGYSPPGFSVCGIYQTRLPFSPSGSIPNPGIEPVFPASPALAGRFFLITEPPGKPTFSLYCTLISLLF